MTFVNGSCSQCYGGYYLSQSSGCIVSNSLCLTIDSNNNCLSCYNGYTIKNGACVITNASCSTYNIDSSCSSCLSGYYLNQNNICISYSTNCLTYDQNSSTCSACQNGYYLSVGACYLLYTGIITATNTTSYLNSNPNCALWANLTVCV